MHINKLPNQIQWLRTECQGIKSIKHNKQDQFYPENSSIRADILQDNK